MSEHKDQTFIIMGQTITLVSDEGAYGLNTIADMGDFNHYMGNEYPTISTAIFAWQEVNSRLLTNQELHQVMIDNLIIEGANNASQKESSEENYQEITDEDIIQEEHSQKSF
jgi:hypothetical protein